MKYFYILSFFVLAIISCGEENSVGDIYSSELQDLSISSIIDFLPAYLTENSEVIYVNGAGQERVMYVRFELENLEREHSGRTYSSESVVVSMGDEIDRSLIIMITGDANYFLDDEVSKSLLCWLRPFETDGSVNFSIPFDDDGPDMEHLNHQFNYRGNQTYLNREFADVYGQSGRDSEQVPFTSYSELMFNSDVGIVGFRDAQDELWVFDRVVE